MGEGKDYYKILGVGRTATKDEIKTAFRKLAHKYHPDKGGDEKKFKEINEAYSILSNEGKRAEYDSYGRTFSGAGQGGGRGGFGGFSAQGGPASGWDFSDFDGGFDVGDIFENFFGGEGPMRERRARRGSDISVDIQISFEESVFGSQRKIIVTKNNVCTACGGGGGEKGTEEITCTTCNGKGKIHETKRSFLGTFTTVRECSACYGKGKVPKEKCPTCRGAGMERKQEEIVITIPPGIEHGEMIRLSGRGEAASRAGVSGDMYVRVHVERHPVFVRDGKNLLMNLHIKLTDALLGAEYSIKTLDGVLALKVPAGVSYGEVLRLREKGIPSAGGRRGDLLVKIILKTPEKLSRKAKDLVEKLKEEGV